MLVFNGFLLAQVNEAPAPIAAALLVKVIGFEKNISAGEITIYVLGSNINIIAKQLRLKRYIQ